MTLHVHSSPAGAAADRGRTLGERWTPQIHTSWAGYERLFTAQGASGDDVRELGLRAAERIEAWAPDLWEEIAGIAAGAGLAAWQAAALNARTELLAVLAPGQRGECSTSVFLSDGVPPRTIQTWDWYDHLRDVKLLWELTPRPGRRVVTFTEFGVVGKIGVNDAGLGIHFNLLGHVRDGDSIGTPVHVIARRILEDATTVAQAVEIARGAPVSASTAITVVTYDGERSEAAVIELSPVGVAVIAPGEDGALLHTNHFLDSALAAGERLGSVDPDTYARQDELRRRREALRSDDPAVRARTLLMHAQDGAGLCCHPDPTAPDGQRWQTLATICLDVAAGRLELHDGSPCELGPESWTIF